MITWGDCKLVLSLREDVLWVEPHWLVILVTYPICHCHCHCVVMIYMFVIDNIFLIPLRICLNICTGNLILHKVAICIIYPLITMTISENVNEVRQSGKEEAQLGEQFVFSINMTKRVFSMRNLLSNLIVTQYHFLLLLLSFADTAVTS